MKLTRIFGIVLGLHVVVIALVMLQPGCQSGKKVTGVDDNETTSVEPDPLDSFNQGTGDNEEPKTSDNEFVSPSRPKPGELIVPGTTDLEPVASGIDLAGNGDSGTIIPQDLSVYKIARGDTLWGVARKNQVSLSSLLSANPKLSKDSKLSIGQEILIPSSSTSAPLPVDVGQTQIAGGTNYVVRSGDSLSKIAKEQGVSLADLMQVNQMNSSSIIRIGQTLIIPDSSGTISSPVAKPVPVPDGATAHVVKKGENLTRISAIYGVSIQDIMEWNGISDSSRIRVGQTLIVSSGSSLAPTDPLIVPQEPAIPQKEANTLENDSLENFFKGQPDDRPVVDEPSDNP